MPIHNWSRVDDSIFHDFQLGWVSELSKRLNQGLLPTSHFALSETVDHRSSPGFLEMPEPEGSSSCRKKPDETRFIGDDVPQVRWVFSAKHVEYATRVVTIRDADCHRVRAAILLVSHQDKRTIDRVHKFAERVVAALSHEIQILVVDLFEPNSLNPQGIHPVIWNQIEPASFSLPTDKSLTLAAYTSGRQRAAYVELVAVGDVLPDMPLFLNPEEYISVPLEASYQTRWEATAKICCAIVETGVMPDPDADE